MIGAGESDRSTVGGRLIGIGGFRWDGFAAVGGPLSQPVRSSRVKPVRSGTHPAMDQNKTPVLDAIEAARREGMYSFALPGHRLGQGIDDRTAEVLSRGAFQADVIFA